jgi:hypothetical protein
MWGVHAECRIGVKHVVTFRDARCPVQAALDMRTFRRAVESGKDSFHACGKPFAS